jgi:hypothetical protein
MPEHMAHQLAELRRQCVLRDRDLLMLVVANHVKVVLELVGAVTARRERAREVDPVDQVPDRLCFFLTEIVGVE